MTINFKRPEYEEHLSNWRLVDDMVQSQNLGDYLIKLNPSDTSAENASRNKQYKERASWLGVSGFTLSGLIGTAFGKDPKIELPASLEFMLGNVDGSGVDAAQQMQRVTREVLKKGRAGLFTTFPDTQGQDVSVADMESLKFVPTVNVIDAKRIINWDTESIGAEVVLSLVVFTDSIVTREGYKRKSVDARRELALENGVFVDRMWIKTDEIKDEWAVYSEAFPTQGNGQPWTRIPFTWVGAVDNNSEIDKAPMLDIAAKNRDHYRNSADHEESVWFCGQAQPWATGLTVEVVEQMKAAGLYVGARNMLGLPEGSTFAYAAAPANTMVRQAMLDKVEEMASIGARMIKQGTVAKTATQADGEMSIQHSILSLVAINVEAAYAAALGWAANYMNADGDIIVEINREFMNTPITAQDLTAFKDLILGGIVGPDDAHRYLTRHDIIDPEKPLGDYLDELGARENTVDMNVGNA